MRILGNRRWGALAALLAGAGVAAAGGCSTTRRNAGATSTGTAVASDTSVPTAAWTGTPTVTVSATATETQTAPPSFTGTTLSSATASESPPPAASATDTPTLALTLTVTVSATATVSETAALTPPVTLTFGLPTIPGTSTDTASATTTATRSATGTRTATSTPLPTATGTYVYIWGGDNDVGTYLSSCYSALVTGPGTLGTWTATTPLPAVRSNIGYASNSQYIFAVGGSSGGGGLNTVYFAPYGGGQAGPWAQASPMPAGMQLMGTGIASGRLWVWGYSGANTYSSPLVGNLPTTWVAAAPAPTVAVNAHWGTDGSFLYHAGGTSAGAPTPFAESWSAQANAGGTVGAWTAGTAHPTTICYGGYGHFLGHLWSVSGSTTNWGANIVSTVYAAPASGGTIGGWLTSANLPVGLIQTAVIEHGGFLYVVGGFQSPTGPANTVFSGAVAAGTVSSWTQLSNLPYHVEAHGIAVK